MSYFFNAIEALEVSECMSEVAISAVDDQQARQAQGRIRVEVTADVNITAPIARRLVNIELMKKVGDMIMTGEPELLIDGQKIYWKVPFLVVPPDDDPNTHPTGQYALVDAISGLYVLEDDAIEQLKTTSEPLLDRLYPELEAYMQKIREVRGRR